MKSKTSKFLFTVGGLAIALASAGFAAGGAGRTQSYFGVYRASWDHSPVPVRKVFALADYVLNPVFEAFGPFQPVWKQVEPGIKMQLDPYDMVSRKILETGVWEPESIKAATEHLSPGATFIDIGAHIGYYSLKAATLVGADGHVVSIEPNPQTLTRLRANIEASKASMVTVWPVACAASESTLELYAAPGSNTGESSLSKENASQEGAAPVAYSVAARPLDAIVKEAGLKRIDVIKIDVEGAEYEVLKGAANTLDEFRPVLIIELVADQLKSMGTSIDQVNQFLALHGYTANRKVDQANVEFVPAKKSARVQEELFFMAGRSGHSL